LKSEKKHKIHILEHWVGWDKNGGSDGGNGVGVEDRMGAD